MTPGRSAAIAGLLLAAACAGAQTAADGSESRAAVIARNSPQAVAELCYMARRGDAEAQYQLAWVFTHAQRAGAGNEQRPSLVGFHPPQASFCA